jgi:hypothetical protein
MMRNTQAHARRQWPNHTARALPAVIALVGLIVLMAIPFAYIAYHRRSAGVQALHERDADQFICIVFNQLKSYSSSQTNFPALTAEELYQRGVFDDQTMAFLKLRNVHYYSFSSADPDTKVVLNVVLSPVHKLTIPFRGAIAFPPIQVDLTKADILNTNNDYGGLLDLNMYR